MRSQINMTWNNTPHHHTNLYIFLDYGITYCIFVMAHHDKVTCCEKNLKFFYFQNFQQKGFDTIRHDVHIYKLHLYKIN
jgi:hypothetical protein